MTGEAAPMVLDTNWLRDVVLGRVDGVPADAVVRRRPLNLVSTSSVLYTVVAETPAGRPVGRPCVLKLPRAADHRHAREVAFYRGVAPRLAGLVPVCHSASDGDDGRAHLLVEDCSPGRVQHVMDVAPAHAVTAMVRALARLHARLWQNVPEPAAQPEPAVDDDFLARTLAGWHGPLTDVDLDRIGDAHAHRDRLRSRLSPVVVACHGDYHSLNVFLGQSDARVIDWQDWYPGNPAEDLARLFTTYVHPLDRRRHERAWLDRYLDQLALEGVAGYEREHLLADYRVAVELALLTPLRLLAVRGLHPDNVLARTKHTLLAVEDVLAG